MTMEELVMRFAELQEERKALETQAEKAVRESGYDEEIFTLEKELKRLKQLKAETRYPYEWDMGQADEKMEVISAQILNEWDGEKKTRQYPAGTLKFRTTQSLRIKDATLVLAGLLDHTSVVDVATNYIKGFNLTAVKKYMGVLALPMGAAELAHKTTVKLEARVDYDKIHGNERKP